MNAATAQEAYEFAAKAAGVKFHWANYDVIEFVAHDVHTQLTWDPVHDGRITIELIAKLSLLVDVDGGIITVVAPKMKGLANNLLTEPIGQTPELSLRLAVLRMAIDIGRVTP